MADSALIAKVKADAVVIDTDTSNEALRKIRSTTPLVNVTETNGLL